MSFTCLHTIKEEQTGDDIFRVEYGVLQDHMGFIYTDHVVRVLITDKKKLIADLYAADEIHEARNKSSENTDQLMLEEWERLASGRLKPSIDRLWEAYMTGPTND